MEGREFEQAKADGFARPPVEPRPAAGVILGRDAPGGPEVLLVRRRSDLDFAAGAYVFPGGVVDLEDGDARWAAQAAGWESLGPEVAPFAVAACRELFEETGVFLALGPGGAGRPPAGPVRQLRAALAAGRSFRELLAGAGLSLDLSRLVLCARWIPPAPLSRRYDARFFLARATSGAGQVATDAGELLEGMWIRPAEALRRYEAGEVPMLFPTAVTLSWLAGGASVAEWLERFRGPQVEPILPRLRRVEGDVRPVLTGTREYVHGALAIVRAPNPGPLTLDGTCAYVLGSREVVIVDPGPAVLPHLEAIRAAVPAGARVTSVAVTHAHADHAEAARALAEGFGVEVAGSALALERLGLDKGRPLGEGATIEFEEDSLQAIAAPGHSADHLCFLWHEAKALFCGDVILGAGSAMIAPPDGDLAQYLDTLGRLRSLDLLTLYPGHGPPVLEPGAKIDEYIGHRLERERQILDALRAGASTVPEIRARVYGPLELSVAWAAEANVGAHLKKLVDEGRAVRRGARYGVVS